MDSPLASRLNAFDAPHASDAADRPLIDDIRRLTEDARALATAEAEYQKARAAFAGQEIRAIVVAGLLAAALGFFALMALTIGLLLGLTPIITAWGATLVVVGMLVAGAFAGVAFATRRWSRMRATLADQEDGA